ncbi:hypothetical protein ACHAXN_000548 [Cyclotella atomus]
MAEGEKKGTIFLGVDERTWGKEGTGWVDYDPEYECTGGSSDPADKHCPHTLKDSDAMGLQHKGREGRLLHVNLASFRDPLCPRTLKYMFTKSKRPNDLRVRVLQQNIPEEDEDCLEGYCRMMAELRKETGGGDTSKGGPAGEECPHKDQVFIHQIHAREAAGPTYARGLVGMDMHAAYERKEISPQDFCMSTDSHMDFEPEWDEKMIDMWDITENEYAVLSTYVANIGKNSNQLGENLNGVHEVPHLCMITFTSQVRTHATKCARNLPKPKLTNAIWGAGLSFSKCHAELKVPVDPHTPGVFDGEEFNRAARFWTHGYDIYTPHRVYVLHDYPGSQHNPKTSGWGTGKFTQEEVRMGNARLKTMLDMPGGESDPEKALVMKRSRYGLGDRRSLDELIQFSGIDLRNRKVTIDGKNRCGNIQWVPFTEHPKGVNFIPRFNETTEDPLDVPYDKTSVWYDPRVDGVAAGLVARAVKTEVEIDPAEVAKLKVEEEAAHAAHEKEAKELARGDLHEEHKALKEKLSAQLRDVPQSPEVGHREVISNAAAAALKAEQMENQVHKFPPLIRGADSGIPKGRFHLGPMKMMSKHGIQHLPMQIQLSIFIMVIGICAAVIVSTGSKSRGGATRSKKRG